MREVVTLQVGEYANCVGAHYWNLQAQEFDRSREVNASLFRPFVGSPSLGRVVCTHA
jgi:hypothetical protein